MNIGFIRGHVAQLTQSISQLALKPGKEEIKKKGIVAVLEIAAYASKTFSLRSSNIKAS